MEAKNLSCGVCGRADYHMDFPGFLGRADKVFGVQVCAYCGDGPEKTAIAAIGVSGGGRGKNGTLGRRRLPKELNDEEYQLYALEWLAGFLHGLANEVRRTGETAEQRLLARWNPPRGGRDE